MTLSDIVRFDKAREAAENMKRNKEIDAPTIPPANNEREKKEEENHVNLS